MKNTLTRRAVLAALAFGGAPAVARAQGRVNWESAELWIEGGGRRHRFTVEIADTDERRQVGLMHRRQLAPDAGMLFDFKRDQVVAMWMRNTLIPLDMLFITRDGEVLNIAERTVPLSEVSVYSAGPVRAVLEVAGGTSARLGLKPGDRVIHPLFSRPPGSSPAPSSRPPS